MAGHQFIKFKGKEIILIDHRGLKGTELLNNYKNAALAVKNYKGIETLIMADFTDATNTQEMMNYINSEESKEIMKKVKKTAVLGITGAKMLLVNIVNMVTNSKARAFDSEEQAKEWLVD